MITRRFCQIVLLAAVSSAPLAQRGHAFLVSVPTPPSLRFSQSSSPSLLQHKDSCCRRLRELQKPTGGMEEGVLCFRKSKTSLGLAEGVSVAMMLEEDNIVRFRTVSSIQAGTTEGLPEALAIVDALQLILPEPGSQVQHEHGYAYGRLLIEREDGSMLASEEAVQIPPEDLVEILPYTITDSTDGNEVYCLTPKDSS